MTGASTVLVQDDGAVRTLVLNRPERRNAIDLDLRVRLAELVRQANDDPRVRALVLAGAGEVFCSGGDIDTMGRMDEHAARARTDAAHEVVRAIRRGKPAVAAVHGGAFGAGLALALACDHVVASDDVRTSTSFTRVGLAGDMAISLALAQRMGAARARQMLMLPREVRGSEVLALGLVDVQVPPEQVRHRALVDAQRLAEGPPLALAALKRRFDNLPSDIDAVLDLEAEDQVRLFGTKDLAEARRPSTSAARRPSRGDDPTGKPPSKEDP